MSVGLTHTHTKHQIPLHIHPTSYTDIVQANDRLLSALKCFFFFFVFVFSLNVFWMNHCVFCYLFLPKATSCVSLYPHTAVNVQLLSVLLSQKETLGDLPSLSLRFSAVLLAVLATMLILQIPSLCMCIYRYKCSFSNETKYMVLEFASEIPLALIHLICIFFFSPKFRFSFLACVNTWSMLWCC